MSYQDQTSVAEQQEALRLEEQALLDSLALDDRIPNTAAPAMELGDLINADCVLDDGDVSVNDDIRGILPLAHPVLRPVDDCPEVEMEDAFDEHPEGSNQQQPEQHEGEHEERNEVEEENEDEPRDETTGELPVQPLNAPTENEDGADDREDEQVEDALVGMAPSTTDATLPSSTFTDVPTSPINLPTPPTRAATPPAQAPRPRPRRFNPTLVPEFESPDAAMAYMKERKTSQIIRISPWPCCQSWGTIAAVDELRHRARYFYDQGCKAGADSPLLKGPNEQFNANMAEDINVWHRQFESNVSYLAEKELRESRMEKGKGDWFQGLLVEMKEDAENRLRARIMGLLASPTDSSESGSSPPSSHSAASSSSIPETTPEGSSAATNDAAFIPEPTPEGSSASTNDAGSSKGPTPPVQNNEDESVNAVGPVVDRRRTSTSAPADDSSMDPSPSKRKRASDVVVDEHVAPPNVLEEIDELESFDPGSDDGSPSKKRKGTRLTQTIKQWNPRSRTAPAPAPAPAAAAPGPSRPAPKKRGQPPPPPKVSRPPNASGSKLPERSRAEVQKRKVSLKLTVKNPGIQEAVPDEEPLTPLSESGEDAEVDKEDPKGKRPMRDLPKTPDKKQPSTQLPSGKFTKEPNGRTVKNRDGAQEIVDDPNAVLLLGRSRCDHCQSNQSIAVSDPTSIWACVISELHNQRCACCKAKGRKCSWTMRDTVQSMTTAAPPSSDPFSAGPSTAGPSNRGPWNAGPSNAGPSNAGPSTADRDCQLMRWLQEFPARASMTDGLLRTLSHREGDTLETLRMRLDMVIEAGLHPLLAALTKMAKEMTDAVDGRGTSENVPDGGRPS